jgi:hypothetical protein
MNAQPDYWSDVDVLRGQFAETHQMVLRSFFTTEECDDILEWADFKEGRLGNCFGDPDSHPILSRVNAKLADIFGRSYTHIQTAIHYSSDRSPNTHNAHIDFPQRLFAYSPEDNLQIWALVRADGVKPEDTLLNLWTGFRPDASKTFDRNVSKLEKHEVSGLTVGDVLVFSSWLPHSSGSIDRPYERHAFKVHYYSDRAVTDYAYLRQHVRDAIRVSSKETHAGTATALFAAEKLLGAWSRALVKFPLALYRRRQTPNKGY